MKRLNLVGVCIALAGLSVAACADPQDTGEATETQAQDWWVDGGNPITPPYTAQGHEILLHDAILLANSQGTAYPEVPSADTCFFKDANGRTDTTNYLLKGNCGTDMADPTLQTYLGVNAPEMSDWHSSPGIQDTHFLRNYVGASGVVGGWRACHQSRDRIVTATRWAVNFWRKNDKNSAYFYAGHATHTIQDSFSPVHSVRQADNFIMKDICAWNRSVAGVCLHDEWNAVTHDAIGAFPELSSASIDSTVGYLTAVWQLFQSTACATNDEACETAVRAKLQPFFDTPSTYGGLHTCGSLPNQPKVTWTKVGRPASARKIAGCDNGYIYALNADKSLYVNKSGGVDTGWTYLDKPTSAQAIVCGAGNTLYAFNTDKTLWKYTGVAGALWTKTQTLGSAAKVAANYQRMYAVNTNNSVWTYISSWSNVGTYASPGVIAGGSHLNPVTNSREPRLFMLAGGNVYMNLANGRNGHWQNINRAASALEISGGKPNKLWALNTDYSLYTGTISE